MTNLSFILAEIGQHNERWGTIFGILAWGFLIAAIVWLLIWMLLGASEDEVGSSDSTESVEQPVAAQDKQPAQPKAAEVKSDLAKPVAPVEKVKTKVESAPSVSVAEKPAAEPEQPTASPPNAAETAGALNDQEKDDFLKLGLTEDTAKLLNAAGVTQYEQVADWSADDIADAKTKYSGSNADVDFDQLPWKANALANGIDLDSVSDDDPAFGAPFSAPASVDHDSIIASNFAGQDVRNDNDLGVVYNADAVAAHVDDLQAIKGVGPKLSSELNSYGVYCYKQIANWSDHNVTEFSERLNCFKNRIERDRWIPQAATMECSTLPGIDTATSEEAASAFSEELKSGIAKQDDVYGIIYTSMPEEIDDLKKIKGIAKVLEGKLHGIGVYRFKQIAVWTNAACKEFSKMLTFKDRIYRDDWIAQAKSFHEDKYDEKL